MTARVILALLVMMAVVVLMLSESSQDSASAQVPPSPTVTGPNVEIYNPAPDAETSDEASRKQDLDTLYHLNSNAVNVPSGAFVRYELLSGTTLLGRIGTATQVGDAHELFWDLTYEPTASPGSRTTAADDEYTLRAVLVSTTGDTLDTDTEPLEVNNTTTSPPTPEDPEAQAETVEITEPDNADGLGVFARTGATSFAITGVASAGTTFVRLFYNLQPPGSDPTWTPCAEGYFAPTDQDPGTTDRKEFSAVCSLAEADRPRGASITGVAAVANDANASAPAQLRDQFDDSGDAHRVTAYFQTATQVTMSPSSQTAQEDQCANNITATVTDQNGAVIAGINVDVHAIGPTDLLKFNVTAANQEGRNAAQPPNSNHPRTEAARDCGAGTDPGAETGTQGEHQNDTGLDIKHIESVAGTDTDGRFVFTLFSPDRGTTTVGAWADTDDDDLWCSAERSGTATIDWTTASTVTSLGPDITSCPATPSPTPTRSPTLTPTPTPTPTPTATATASPTPTPTTSPDPRGCTVVGTENSERLRGTGGDDVICAYGGDDVIFGRGGDDTIYADAGDDEIHGGKGTDVIRGGAGGDAAEGGAQKDDLIGDGGKDLLLGGGASDRLLGGAGNDDLRGGKGRDRLRGGRGNDRLDGGPRDDSCRGGPGRDRLKSC